MASLIDLHTHTSYSSACGRMSAEELIEAAIEAGLDGVAVTEHHLIEGAEVAQRLVGTSIAFLSFGVSKPRRRSLATYWSLATTTT